MHASTVTKYAMQESEAQELLSSGWIPPVQVDEDISAHTRRLMQGMRIQ